jgi:transcriptional regulator with XRE-family HTH domain
MRVAHEDDGQLKIFLRGHRQRIDPHARRLGDFGRLPVRWGRPVTQEEVAEAIGVSRVWYAMLESGTRIRTSTKILDRLAAALMLDSTERVRLFHLAVPELGRVEVGAESALVLESFSVVRAATKRLWVATTEVEALETMAEHVAGIFGDADLVFYVRRLDEGKWEWQHILDSDLAQRNDATFEGATSGMTPAEVDELVLFPQLSQPGEIGTETSYTSTTSTVRAAQQEIFGDPRLGLGSLLHARVRSRSGLVGGYTVKHLGGHRYSPEQQAIVGALAELTSVALS